MLQRLIILCLFVFFASCEDKKSSTETTPVSTSEIEENQPIEEDTSETASEGEKEEEKPEGPLIVQEEFIPFMTEYGEENPADKIRIETKFGNIDVQLYQNTPLHRANFIFLVEQNYFEDTFFYRVAPGFVIQAGNSDNQETNVKRHHIGDYLIPGEFEAGHRHVRGAFSAAKYEEQNRSKASSPYEFFIVTIETGAPHLNNEHTVFGRVIDGMDVVEEISAVETGDAEWPLQNIYIDVEIIE